MNRREHLTYMDKRQKKLNPQYDKYLHLMWSMYKNILWVIKYFVLSKKVQWLTSKYLSCQRTFWPPVIFGETGCKIYCFIKLYKSKSIWCKWLYIKSTPLSTINTKSYTLLLRCLKILVVLFSVNLH